jgi:hypothetical protein
VIRIIETKMDGDGNLHSREPLGVVFVYHHTAASFLIISLPREFADGRSGYDLAGDFWWGHHAHGEMIHRYTIEGEDQF